MAWRRALMRGLARLLPGPRSAQPEDLGAGARRVLFIRHQRVGDLLMATGAIRAIARSHPGTTVDVLVSPGSLAILDRNPDVHEVVPFSQRQWTNWPGVMRRLRRARYDVIVDGRVNQAPAFTTTVALMAAAGARLRVGAPGAAGGGVFNLPVRPAADSHFVEQTAAVAVPFGVDPATVDLHPALYLSDAERMRAERQWEAARPGGLPLDRLRRVLVNLSVSSSLRRWPEERWVAALRYLRARDPAAAILVTGTPGDAEQARRIAEAASAAWLAPGLRDAMALVATADLLVTPNTGLSHVASAFRTPIVEMLPRSHVAFVAYRTPGRSLLGVDDTLASVDLDRVKRALDEVLDELASTPRRAR